MMGCNFQIMLVPGDKTFAQVKDIFLEAQMEDRHKNCHSYSGGFAMASGLKKHYGNGSDFHDAQSAETYLQANCVQWEEAMAVRFKNGHGVEWMIGAWCAS